MHNIEIRWTNFFIGEAVFYSGLIMHCKGIVKLNTIKIPKEKIDGEHQLIKT